ncbi:MAG: thiamine-binding protein [Geodermatophilaceae bacterium]
MIVEIQCLPSPAGTAEDPHAHIEAAIAIIADSGVHYEVGPLGTTFEGDPDRLWPLLRRIHEAVLDAGATTAISVVKIAEGRGESARTMDSLTAKFR